MQPNVVPLSPFQLFDGGGQNTQMGGWSSAGDVDGAVQTDAPLYFYSIILIALFGATIFTIRKWRLKTAKNPGQTWTNPTFVTGEKRQEYSTLIDQDDPGIQYFTLQCLSLFCMLYLAFASIACSISSMEASPSSTPLVAKTALGLPFAAAMLYNAFAVAAGLLYATTLLSAMVESFEFLFCLRRLFVGRQTYRFLGLAALEMAASAAHYYPDVVASCIAPSIPFILLVRFNTSTCGVPRSFFPVLFFSLPVAPAKLEFARAPPLNKQTNPHQPCSVPPTTPAFLPCICIAGNVSLRTVIATATKRGRHVFLGTNENKKGKKELRAQDIRFKIQWL